MRLLRAGDKSRVRRLAGFYRNHREESSWSLKLATRWVSHSVEVIKATFLVFVCSKIPTSNLSELPAFHNRLDRSGNAVIVRFELRLHFAQQRPV